MPPITNAHDLGKVDEKTTDVFIEATGRDAKTIQLAMEVLVAALIDMGGRAYSVKIEDRKKSFASPSFKEEKRTINVSYVNKILGLNLGASEIANHLERMGHTVRRAKGDEIAFTVPATRSDIWHDIDIVDDIARSYGFNAFELNMRPVATIGETIPSMKVKEEISRIMIGLGYQEVFTLVLSSRQDQFERMNIEERDYVQLGKSVEQSVNMVRLWILPELMKSLQHNRSVSYPQRLFEVNYTVLPDKTADVCAKDILSFSAVSSHSNASFTEMKQIVEYVLRVFGFAFELAPLEHDSFIPGRVARVVVCGREVGFFGEMHPQVLANWGMGMPVAALEVSLSELFDLK